jgi:hypothetical protein
MQFLGTRTSLGIALPAILIAGLAFGRPASTPAVPAADAPAPAAAPTPAPPAAPAAVELDRSLEPVRTRDLPTDGPFIAHRAAFDVTFDEQPIPYAVFAVTTLPGETVVVSAPGAVTLRHAAGVAQAAAAGSWSWTAPAEPGIVPLALENGDQVVRLNVLVLHPREGQQGDALNGYRIGRYLAKPLRGSPRYLPPEGFVAVRREDHDVLLSPHLALGQFRCKQPGEPAYLHVTEALLLKLEAVLEAANEAGYDAPTLHVMSGFRTPAYNAGIGNETVYSRHLWGDAADIWVDADGDGEMDDWSGNGRVDLADARVLLAIAERVEAQRGILAGGLGLYRANSAHGPFVHVDARGWAARW